MFVLPNARFIPCLKHKNSCVLFFARILSVNAPSEFTLIFIGLIVMKGITVIVCIVMFCINSMQIFAQQDSTSALKFVQASGGNLTIAQSSNYDWQQGEKSLLDIKSSFRNSSTVTFPYLSVRSSIRAILGVLSEKNESYEESLVHTTDNELFGEVVLTVPLGWKVDPYISSNFKTQITESHRVQNQSLIRLSKFWDPVISQQAMGLTYGLSGKVLCFSIRSGANLQQIRTQDYTALTDDPLTQLIKEQYKATAGMECVLESTLKLDSLITLRVRANSQKNILTNDSWIAQTESELLVKVWKMVGVVLSIAANYNELQTKRVQIKQSLQLGLLIDM